MKRIALFVLILIPCLFTLSCNKDKENGGGGGNGKTSGNKASLGIVVNDAEGIIEVPQRQSKSFNMMVTAEPGPDDAITVKVGVDAGLVNTYNTDHGTAYKMLPAEAYELPSAGFLLPRYNKQSAYATLQLKGFGCDLEQVYVLPLVIAKVEGSAAYETPDDKVAYILFKMLPPQQQGAGTMDDPYLINDVEEFVKMDNLLLDNETTYFKLNDDIDFTDVEFTEENPWIPIDASNGRKVFLDGNGHTIKNFTADAGIFSILCGTVQNLTIDGANVECLSKNKGGILAGNGGQMDDDENVTGTVNVKNVTVKNSTIVNEYNRTGALIGWFISGSAEDITVSGCSVSGGQQVGGIFGRIENGTFTNCSASGEVHSSNYYSGGFVGYVGTGTFLNCSTDTKVSNVLSEGNYARVGGLIGEMHGGSVEKCHATGDVEGTGHFGGGLIGVADAKNGDITITQSYANCKVAFTISGNKAGYGGLIGRMESGNVTVTDCYSTGSVKAFRWSAGFVGDVNKGVLTITNGYCSSDISAIGPDGNGNYECGIVVGKVRDASATTIKCTGFVAWNVSDREFCFPTDAVPLGGNYYGTEGTVSSQASTLGWDTSVWDFSSAEPKLK